MHQAGQTNKTQCDQPGVRDRANVRLKEHSQTGSSSRLAHAIIALVIVVILAAALVITWEMVLTLFLAILFGVFLNHSSNWLSDRTPLPHQASLAAVILSLVCACAGFSTLFFVQINQEIEEASEQMEKGLEEVRNWSQQYASVRSMIRSTPFLEQYLLPESSQQSNQQNPEETTGSPSDNQPTADNSNDSQSIAQAQQQPSGLNSMQGSAKQAVTFAGAMFKSTFGIVVNAILIFFVGIFLAVAPQTYREGTVVLFAPERRDQMRALMIRVGDTLWSWLLGRFGSMIVTGLGAWLVLSLIGVPMPGTLGLIAGLLTFIPNIGSLIAFCVTILVALPKGPTTAALVVPAFIGLQLVESYLITPLIQKKQVSLPPAMLISFQALMGVLFGFLGAAVASPLLAATRVIVNELYVKGYLERESLPAQTESH